tara:strand:+ start:437 stop:889 length:453 start_codon:yes stop_codon:yes gene_type:complete
MPKQKILKEVNSVFNDFLQEKDHRKTPERFAILNEIYKKASHFNIDEMYSIMKRKKYRVSRATLYNTIELLLNAKLIRKHHFENHPAEYEKCYFSRQHDHLICDKCNKIIEFCEPRMHNIKQFISEELKFKIERHTLNMYGLCESCQNNK